MATYRVGQKVLIVKGPASVQEGIVKDVNDFSLDDAFPGFHIRVDAARKPNHKGWLCRADQLVPLLPDSQWADEQIAKLKKLGEVVELTPKQMEEVRG